MQFNKPFDLRQMSHEKAAGAAMQTEARQKSTEQLSLDCDKTLIRGCTENSGRYMG